MQGATDPAAQAQAPPCRTKGASVQPTTHTAGLHPGNLAASRAATSSGRCRRAASGPVGGGTRSPWKRTTVCRGGLGRAAESSRPSPVQAGEGPGRRASGLAPGRHTRRRRRRRRWRWWPAPRPVARSPAGGLACRLRAAVRAGPQGAGEAEATCCVLWDHTRRGQTGTGGAGSQSGSSGDIKTVPRACGCGQAPLHPPPSRCPGPQGARRSTPGLRAPPTGPRVAQQAAPWRRQPR